MEKKNQGFTLIEILISLIIFAFGMLGVAMQMSKSISSTVNNEVHSSVMQLAMQSIEPLNRSVLQSKEHFKTALKNLSTAGQTPAFATNNSAKNTFNIQVNNASDSNNKPLLSTTLIDWAPPYKITLKIDYTGKDSSTLSFFTTHVLVPAITPP